MNPRHILVGLAAALAIAVVTAPTQAFCCFYVAKADTGLFNKASKVVIARNGPRTVTTMVNDYLCDPKEFAIVEHLDAKTGRNEASCGWSGRHVASHEDQSTNCLESCLR